MKKFLVLAIITLATSIAAFGQNAMSVKEYFLAIPSDYIKAEAKDRADWIKAEENSIGYLSFEMPADEFPGGKELEEEGVAYGNVQVFKKNGGGALIGMAVNLCAESKCVGQMLLLDYTAGKWEDVTSDLSPIIDNDEVVKTLKNAPAFDNKESLKEGVEVPLAIEFNGNEKVINYLAGCVGGCDGAIAVKIFKWNGSIFNELEETESPE